MGTVTTLMPQWVSSQWAVNLWPNADLELGGGDWFRAETGWRSWHLVAAHEGVLGLYWYDDHAYGGVVSEVKSVVEENTKYTFSAWLFFQGSINFKFAILDQDDNEISSIDISGSGWERKSITFTTGSGDTGIKLKWTKDNDTDNSQQYLDQVMLETGDTMSDWVNYK